MHLCILLQVYGVAWNDFQRCHNRDGEQVVRPGMFVTYGLKHLKIWTLELDSVSVCCLLCWYACHFGNSLW